MTSIKTSPRFLAAIAVERVIGDGAFSGVALNQSLNQINLSSADRALTTELFYGVLRWKTALDTTIKNSCKKPGSKIHKKIRAHLWVAAYQLHHLQERIPSFAAINEAVKAIKKVKPPLSGFANALLRNLVEAPHQKLKNNASLEEIATAYSFSPSLLKLWLHPKAAAPLKTICENLNQRPDLTLRAQGSLKEIETWAKSIKDHGKKLDKHPWCPHAFMLEAGGDVRKLPGYEEGRFWVQDAASQTCALICNIESGMRVMDLCAAPGGKSLILQSYLKAGEHVQSIEIAEHKKARMLENSARMNLPFSPIIADVKSLAQQDQWQHQADVILLDAPCSATGTFRRHPEVKWQKSIENARAAQALQKELLQAARLLLKPGGRLIYSVCSPFLEEGPQVIADFLGQHPDFKIESAKERAPFLPDSAVTNEGFVSFMPHLHQADAFFIAALKNQNH